MEYIFGILQGVIVIAVVWVKITDLGKRVDRMERRLDDFLNHRAGKKG